MQNKIFLPVLKAAAPIAATAIKSRMHSWFTLAAASLLSLAATGVHAHDALPTAAKPQGWSYPFSCCSGMDCREVSSKAISEKPEGYVIKGTGEVLTYADKRLKDSPDGEYHWCSRGGSDTGATICLFVPPQSY